MASYHVETQATSHWDQDSWCFVRTRKHLIYSDDKWDSAVDIEAYYTTNICDYAGAFSPPATGGGDLACRLVEINIERALVGSPNDEHSVWEATGTWSTKVPVDMAYDPTARPTIWRMSYVRTQEPATFTRQATALPIRTSAGEPFRGLVRDTSKEVITAQKNYTPLAFSALGLGALADHTNSGALTTDFGTYAAKTLLFTPGDCVQMHENGIDFIQANFSFAYDANEHELIVLDQGTWALNGLGVRYNPQTPGLGHVLTTFILDGAGGILPVGGDPVNSYLHFVNYFTADMSVLGL